MLSVSRQGVTYLAKKVAMPLPEFVQFRGHSVYPRKILRRYAKSINRRPEFAAKQLRNIFGGFVQKHSFVLHNERSTAISDGKYKISREIRQVLVKKKGDTDSH